MGCCLTASSHYLDQTDNAALCQLVPWGMYFSKILLEQAWEWVAMKKTENILQWDTPRKIMKQIDPVHLILETWWYVNEYTNRHKEKLLTPLLTGGNKNLFHEVHNSSCMAYPPSVFFLGKYTSINSMRLSDAYTHKKIGYHWFRWLVACSASNHYLNQYWLIANWIIRHEFRWSSNQNTTNLFHENGFENVICKRLAMLFRPLCVNSLKPRQNRCHLQTTVWNAFYWMETYWF